MNDTVKAKKDNGDRQVFSRLVWDNLPGDKYGWKEDNTAPEVPDEIKRMLILVPAKGEPLQMETPKQPAKPKPKGKQTPKA